MARRRSSPTSCTRCRTLTRVSPINNASRTTRSMTRSFVRSRQKMGCAPFLSPRSTPMMSWVERSSIWPRMSLGGFTRSSSMKGLLSFGTSLRRDAFFCSLEGVRDRACRLKDGQKGSPVKVRFQRMHWRSRLDGRTICALARRSTTRSRSRGR